MLRTASVCIQSLGRYVYRVIYINVLFIPPRESTAFYLNWYILMHAFPIQLPLLLVKQLEALEMFTSVTLPLPTSPALSPTVECLLANQLKVLPPGQCVDILESLCQYFQEKCLPKLQTHGGVARKRKTKKGRQTLSEYDTGTTGGGLDCLVEKAPFRNTHCYWVGVVLVVRCLHYVVFAFNVLGDPNCLLTGTPVHLLHQVDLGV